VALDRRAEPEQVVARELGAEHDRVRVPDVDRDDRQRLARDLTELAEAWADPHAWSGSTFAGGLELPGEVVGLVAIDELVVHGWDIAVSTDQQYQPSAHEVEAAMAFVTAVDAPRDGRLFGPIVAVADDAEPLDRLLALTGRDPSWRP